MLKFLVDHNIPQSVSEWLIAQTYDVKLVKDINPEMSDRNVSEIAIREARILLTNDSDFVGIYAMKEKGDCIIFRLESQSGVLRIKALGKILPEIKAGKSFGLLILE